MHEHSPQLRPGPTWTFYGRRQSEFTVGHLITGIESLGLKVTAHADSGAPVAAESPLVPARLRLVNGAPGWMEVAAGPTRAEELPPLPELDPRAVDLVATLRGLDCEGRKVYGPMVRSVLCVLGELYPAGLTLREGQSRAFSTDGMRKALQAPARDSFIVGGELTVRRERRPAVSEVLRAHPLMARMIELGGPGLSIPKCRVHLSEDEWAQVYAGLYALTSLASGGQVRVNREGDWDTTMHARG